VVAYTDIFARSGVGELFAGLGLGALPVMGTAMVQNGQLGSAAVAAGIPAFFMTFNLLLLNEFPDESADRQGGRRNLVLLLGRPGAARIYALFAILTPLAILSAVAVGVFPLVAVLGALPFLLAGKAVQWALKNPHEPVPMPALGGNVMWNLLTNALLAVALGLAAWRGW
jgi:1,4-dihydroxy-2-naphthoate polyprenyltransferase